MKNKRVWLNLRLVASACALIGISICLLADDNSYCPGYWTSESNDSGSQCDNNSTGKCISKSYVPDKGYCKESSPSPYPWSCNEVTTYGQYWLTSGSCSGFGLCQTFGGNKTGPYDGGTYKQHTINQCGGA